MSDEMSAEQVKNDFINAMSYFAAGVTIVATGGAAGTAGQTVSAFTSISADPPSILVCLNLDSSGCIPTTENGVFSVNFLGCQHTELSDAFAGRTSVESEHRFEVGNWEAGQTGSPVLVDAPAVIECRVTQSYDVATHRVFFAEVVAARICDGQPLVYAQRRYSQLAPLG